jgi:hypothetical protein
MENTLYGFIIGSTVSFAVVQAVQYVLHCRWTAEQEQLEIEAKHLASRFRELQASKSFFSEEKQSSRRSLIRRSLSPDVYTSP